MSYEEEFEEKINQSRNKLRNLRNEIAQLKSQKDNLRQNISYHQSNINGLKAFIEEGELKLLMRTPRISRLELEGAKNDLGNEEQELQKARAFKMEIEFYLIPELENQILPLRNEIDTLESSLGTQRINDAHTQSRGVRL